jgi:hypothetical protein
MEKMYFGLAEEVKTLTQCMLAQVGFLEKDPWIGFVRTLLTKG